MLYTGQFKTLAEHSIQVNIITSGSSSETTELTFSGDSPVMITQESDDLFAPIKSRSCTITIVAQGPYFDMYSGSSHGTSVEVNDLTDSKCLFYGYLTPCEYSQEYLYLNEIELEAVDALSTLQDFKYTYTGGSSESIVKVADIVKKLYKQAGYGSSGTIYCSYYCRKSYENQNETPLQEMINDDIFFSDDEDHEAISCYEVLEEICRFYGLTATAFGQSIYLIDYSILAGPDCLTAYVDKVRYYDIINGDTVIDDGSGWTMETFDGTEISSGSIGTSVPLFVNKYVSLGKDSYYGEDQTVSMDDVYNKITIKSDVYEIEDDDLGINPEDNLNSATYWRNYQSWWNDEDWTEYSRYYYFNRDTGYGGMLKANNQYYQTYYAVNSQFTTATMGYKLTAGFNNYGSILTWVATEHPYCMSGYLFNVQPCQTCMPTQNFGYQSSKEFKYKADWDNLYSWFTQGYWLARYWNNNNTSWDSISGSDASTKWWNFQDTYFGGNNVYLKYSGDKQICMSPPSGSTSYICFTGSLYYQRTRKYKTDKREYTTYHVWDIDETNNLCGGTHYTLSDVGVSSTDDAYARGTGDSDYNTGWPLLKARLKIGNKFWNGSSWTTSDCAFFIYYHNEEVVSEDEKCTWNTWLKPVTNYDYTYKVGKDAFCIPIENSDGLCGNIEFSLYMPRTLWDSQIYESSGYVRVNYEKIPPIIFMKDFSVEVSTVDKSSSWITADITQVDSSGKEEDEDEITYSNSISGNYVKEMDDIDMKINSWNSKKPLAKSYILTHSEDDGDLTIYATNGFRDRSTKTTQTEELNIINMYKSHYSTPKKIYECQVRGYYNPLKYVKVDGFEDSKFMVDEQEYDVKTGQNSLKLIEY